MTTVQDLRATHKRLTNPANWSPKGPSTPTGLCIYLTLCAVTRSSWSEAHRAIARVVCPEAPSAGALTEWNDARSTKHADVLAVLSRAIEIEAAKAEEFAVDALSVLLVHEPNERQAAT